jgi:hypothetical protein
MYAWCGRLDDMCGRESPCFMLILVFGRLYFGRSGWAGRWG